VTMAERVSEPLVPVMVTVKMPLLEGVQESVELPDPVTLVGERPHEIPVVGLELAERPTVPVKPFKAVTVMLEVPVTPTFGLRLVGLAIVVKSVTVTMTVVEWESDPLDPLTMTVYVEAGPEQESSELWADPRVMLDGLSVHARPLGATDAVSATAPVNPFSGATVIEEAAMAPASTLTVVGLADTE
jgi:hypothetical protein